MSDQPTPRDETPTEAPNTSRDDFYIEPDTPRRAKPNEDPANALPGSMLNYVLIAVTFLVVGVLIGQNLPSSKGGDLTADQVEQIVRGVLVDSNLVSDAPTNEELVDDDPFMGSADAPVVIVEFSDFRCPYCGRHFRETLEPLLENYGDYVRYVYRDYPALGPESVNAALAGACAAEQGKFWETHNLYFANQDKLGRDYYIQTATDLGLDVPTFTTCLDSQKYFDEIKSDFIDGQLNGVEGTPGFFINGTFVRGAQPYELFEKIIERELIAQGITPPAPVVPVDGLLERPDATAEANAESSSSSSTLESDAANLLNSTTEAP